MGIDAKCKALTLQFKTFIKKMKPFSVRLSDDGEVVLVDRRLKMPVPAKTWNQGGTNSHDPLTFLHPGFNYIRQH